MSCRTHQGSLRTGLNIGEASRRKDYLKCLPVEILTLMCLNLTSSIRDMITVSALSSSLRAIIIDTAVLWSRVCLCNTMNVDLIEMITRRMKDLCCDVVIDEEKTFGQVIIKGKSFQANLVSIRKLLSLCWKWRSATFTIRAETSDMIREYYGTAEMTKLKYMKVYGIEETEEANDRCFYRNWSLPSLKSIDDSQSMALRFPSIHAPSLTSCSFSICDRELKEAAAFFMRIESLKDLEIYLYTEDNWNVEGKVEIAMPWLERLSVTFMNADEAAFKVLKDIFHTCNIGFLKIEVCLEDGEHRNSIAEGCRAWLKVLGRRFGKLKTLFLKISRCELLEMGNATGDLGEDEWRRCRLYLIDDILYNLPLTTSTLKISVSDLPMEAFRDDGKGRMVLDGRHELKRISYSDCNMLEVGFLEKMTESLANTDIVIRCVDCVDCGDM